MLTSEGWIGGGLIRMGNWRLGWTMLDVKSVNEDARLKSVLLVLVLRCVVLRFLKAGAGIDDDEDKEEEDIGTDTEGVDETGADTNADDGTVLLLAAVTGLLIDPVPLLSTDIFKVNRYACSCGNKNVM